MDSYIYAIYCNGKPYVGDGVLDGIPFSKRRKKFLYESLTNAKIARSSEMNNYPETNLKIMKFKLEGAVVLNE